MMSSSSCSSSGDGAFAFREEDEEGLGSSEAGDEAEEIDCEAEQQLQCQPRPRAPSRLAVMGSCDMGVFVDQAAAPAVTAAAAAAKAGSSDLASVMSEGTVFNLATAMSLGSNPATRAPGDADLLFDLDDEGGSPASSPSSSSSGRVLHLAEQQQQRSAVMEAASPPAYVAASAACMEAEQHTQFLSGAQLLPEGGAVAGAGASGPVLSVCVSTPPPGLPPTPPGVLPSPAGLPPLPMASSVHMGEIWMLHGLKAKAAAAAAQARCTVSGSSKKTSAAAAAARRRSGVVGMRRFMYPPPVVRAAPRKSNEVLSGLSEEQWVAFMAELAAYMDEALTPATGRWRRASEAAGLGGAAMSCPRF